MKADILKRLEALDAAATAATTGPIVLIEAHRFDPIHRDAFIAGDDGVLDLYAPRDGLETPTGMIHTLVISLHLESQQDWLTTRDMDEDDLDEYEQRIIREDARREREARDEVERRKVDALETVTVRHDYSGYPIDSYWLGT